MSCGRHQLTLLLLLIAFGWLPLSSAPAWAGRLDPELQRSLRARPGQEPVAVIVEFADRVELAPFARHGDQAQARGDLVRALQSKARGSQAPLQAFLRSQGLNARELWIRNALAVTLPAAAVEPLAAWPGVEVVRLDAQVPPPLPLPEPLAAPTAPPTWNIADLGAPLVWEAGFTGQGTVVAILDTGVNLLHPDLTTSWRGGSNSWYDPYTGSTQPYDPVADSFTHGTAVASLVTGREASGFAIGVAPDARWIAAKIFPDSGGADLSMISLAFQWALDPDGNPATADAPDIVNNSWGFQNSPNQCLSFFRPEIQALQAAGIHVVFSAGNAGPDAATSVSPANLPEGLAVGGIGPTHRVTFSSSRGPSPCAPSLYTDLAGDVFPELSAPGEAVQVANLGSSYALATGTSFSAAHLSGALALLRSAFPLAERLELEYALLRSATDLGARGPDNTYGRGLANVAAAYYRLSGVPVLSLHEPSPPEDDDLIAFGSVPVGTLRELTLTLRNVGGGPLELTPFDPAALVAPFTLNSNSCGSALAADSSCALVLGFAPEAAQGYLTTLTLASNDPLRPVRTLSLSGFGNAAPPPPELVSPANNATGVAIPVTFRWNQGPDPDGDPLTITLLVATNSSFFSPQSFRVAWPETLTAGLSGWAGVAGLLLAASLILLRRRRLLAGALALVLLTSSSCGEGDSPPAGVPLAYTVSSLAPDTTYFWKVRVDDGQGGLVESSVRTFTTRP